MNTNTATTSSSSMDTDCTVRFSDSPPTVRYLDDSEEDRHSPWLTMALDRARFRRRIRIIESILRPVLLKCLERQRVAAAAAGKGDGDLTSSSMSNLRLLRRRQKITHDDNNKNINKLARPLPPLIIPPPLIKTLPHHHHQNHSLMTPLTPTTLLPPANINEPRRRYKVVRQRAIISTSNQHDVSTTTPSVHMYGGWSNRKWENTVDVPTDRKCSEDDRATTAEHRILLRRVPTLVRSVSPIRELSSGFAGC